MSKPTVWRLPLAALVLVGVLLLTVLPLSAGAVDTERTDAVESGSISRCGGDRP